MEGSRCDILASGFFGILLPEVLSKPATGLPAPYLDTAKLEAKRSLFFPQCFLLGSKEKFPKAPLAHSHHQYVFSFFESPWVRPAIMVSSLPQQGKPNPGCSDDPIWLGFRIHCWKEGRATHYPLNYVREYGCPNSIGPLLERVRGSGCWLGHQKSLPL